MCDKRTRMNFKSVMSSKQSQDFVTIFRAERKIMNNKNTPFELTLFSEQENSVNQTAVTREIDLPVNDSLETDTSKNGEAEINEQGQKELSAEKWGDHSKDTEKPETAYDEVKIRTGKRRPGKSYLIMGARYVESRIQAWKREEGLLKEKYPEYSLENAIKNPIFLKMLSLDISQEQAYRATHFDSILREEMDRATCLYSDNLRARGVRPSENGVIGSGGVTMKNGVSSLSRGQRADIAKRAFNGEKISF